MKAEMIYDAEIHDAPEFSLERELSDAEIADLGERFPGADYWDDLDGPVFCINMEKPEGAEALQAWIEALPAQGA